MARQPVGTVAPVAAQRILWGIRLRSVGQALRKNPTMTAGLVLLLVMSVVAITASWIQRYQPTMPAPVERLKSPGAAHWLGTDNLGRDLYARVVHGARISLTVGFSVAVITSVIGAAIGIMAGYLRRLDEPVMRIMDGLMAFPALLLAIALMAVLGSSLRNVIIAIAIVDTPRMVRLVRASTLTLRDQTFVEAGRAVGASPLRIMLLHILPNTIAPITVQATYFFAQAVLLEAYLSFLGAGVPPGVPSWGNIISESRQFIQRAPWMSSFPGVTIALTVLAMNLVGDGLRDLLDPKLRRRL